MTKELANNNAYEKAIFQLSRMLTPTSEQSVNLLQKLYFVITGSIDDIPAIAGIVCTPEARLSDVKQPANLDKRFYHFDSDLLTAIENFGHRQNWNAKSFYDCIKLIWILQSFEIKHYVHNDVSCVLPTSSKTSSGKNSVISKKENQHKFRAIMTYCSVGRKLVGVKNVLNIAKRITSHDFDHKTMMRLNYRTKDSTTIFLTAKQHEILEDTSKYKFIFGPPGTGKTLLVVLAAIQAIEEKRGKVIVLTLDFLIERTKKLLESNVSDSSQIDVRSISKGIRVNANDCVFADEVNAHAEDVQTFLEMAKKTKTGTLFVAISGGQQINELCAFEGKLKETLADVDDCKLFQLTDILRGTASIIDFWTNRLNEIMCPERLPMECGHSIAGEPVKYAKFLRSEQVFAKMCEKVDELLQMTDPKNIAIISYEKAWIERHLRKKDVRFGSALAQEHDESLITVDLVDNIYSREWPFVVVISLLPNYVAIKSVIASSRAITSLTFIERDELEIRQIFRRHCTDDKELRRTLASLADYSRFRNKITSIADDSEIIGGDLIIEIIANNHFDAQVKRLFPMFRDCNTLVQFFDMIIERQHWMLLLIFRQSVYDEKDSNSGIAFVSNNYWHETYGVEQNVNKKLQGCAKRAVELINVFIRPEVKREIRSFMNRHANLFDMFDNVEGKHHFDLMALAIIRYVSSTLTVANCRQPFKLTMEDRNKFDAMFSEVFRNLEHLVDALTTALCC